MTHECQFDPNESATLWPIRPIRQGRIVTYCMTIAQRWNALYDKYDLILLKVHVHCGFSFVALNWRQVQQIMPQGCCLRI